MDPPLELVKLSRSNSTKICKEEFYSAPNSYFYASQKYVLLWLQDK